MFLVKIDAHRKEVVCWITLAEPYKNVRKLSNQWSNFAQPLNNEYWVDPESES